jgi:hypothetical protein
MTRKEREREIQKVLRWMGGELVSPDFFRRNIAKVIIRRERAALRKAVNIAADLCEYPKRPTREELKRAILGGPR